jgi:hypothetical protein
VRRHLINNAAGQQRPLAFSEPEWDLTLWSTSGCAAVTRAVVPHGRQRRRSSHQLAVGFGHRRTWPTPGEGRVLGPPHHHEGRPVRHPVQRSGRSRSAGVYSTTSTPGQWLDLDEQGTNAPTRRCSGTSGSPVRGVALHRQRGGERPDLLRVRRPGGAHDRAQDPGRDRRGRLVSRARRRPRRPSWWTGSQPDRLDDQPDLRVPGRGGVA